MGEELQKDKCIALFLSPRLLAPQSRIHLRHALRGIHRQGSEQWDGIPNAFTQPNSTNLTRDRSHKLEILKYVRAGVITNESGRKDAAAALAKTKPNAADVTCCTYGRRTVSLGQESRAARKSHAAREKALESDL